MGNNIKIYETSKIINSNPQYGDVIGENSFVKDTTLGKNVHINRSNMIVSSIIGDYTYTGMNTVIKNATIGKFCSISWNVSISGSIHHYEFVSSHPFVYIDSFGLNDKSRMMDIKRVSIGNDVWIGMNSCVLPGVSVSDGAVIGAGSVVTKDVPPYAVVAGNPAKIIKYRFDADTISRLSELQFWDVDEEIIRENISLFECSVDSELLKKLEHKIIPKVDA